MERGAWMKELTDPHELYGLSLDEFIPARAALVKSLRRDGQRDEAETASKLRKPSVAAWAVNQLVRTQPREITSLLEAGDALQAAQAELLGKRGDAKSLQAAVAREREAVSQLVERARGLLESKGQPPSQAVLDRVSQTLEAAALDEAARAVVEAGCLERELQHIGLGSGSLSAQPAQPAQPAQAARAKSRRPRGSEESGSRAAQERRERERAEQMKTDRKAEQEARRIAERADREFSQAQQRRDDAADALAEADDQLAQVRDRAERTADEHRQAEETLRQRKA
jgi:hypothetical protein